MLKLEASNGWNHCFVTFFSQILSTEGNSLWHMAILLFVLICSLYAAMFFFEAQSTNKQDNLNKKYTNGRSHITVEFEVSVYRLFGRRAITRYARATGNQRYARIGDVIIVPPEAANEPIFYFN
ncbi:hypothetical protein ACJX0J_032369 [Zea mays]